ncbi:unnamed protein product, partial [Meganyctiphanes norvegica]
GSAPMKMLLPLVVAQKGVSMQGIGFLWSVLMVIGLITSSIACTVADYLKAHKAVLLTSLIFLTVGTNSLYLMPSLLKAPEESLNQTQLYNISKYNEKISGVNMSMVIGNKSKTSANINSLEKGIIGIEADSVDEEVYLSSQKVEDNTSTRDFSISELLKMPEFWYIFLCLLLEQFGTSTCVTMTDTVCFTILGDDRHKYGEQRVWGTVGMGLFCIVSGGLIDLYSQNLPQKDYLPAFILSFVILIIDIALVAKMKIPSKENGDIKFGEVGSTILDIRVFIFLTSVIVGGLGLGMIWIFKLILVEDVALAWDKDFPALKLLQGLDMGIETFGGEVAFFFLSGMIIKRLGHPLVFIMGFTALGLRSVFYAVVSNPWIFLPIEFLNGPSYSFFHTAISSYASLIAPNGAQALFQALNRAFFCIGYSIAGMLGGWSYQEIGGSKTFLVLGISILLYTVLYAISQALLKYKENKKGLNPSNVCEEDPSIKCLQRQISEKESKSFTADIETESLPSQSLLLTNNTNKR